MNFSSPEKYKPTDFYRSLVDTKKIIASGAHEEFKFIPNHKTVAKTWDAKHMDKFIQKSPWGGTTAGTLPTGVSFPTGTLQTQSTLSPPQIVKKKTPLRRAISLKLDQDSHQKEKQNIFLTYSKTFHIKKQKIIRMLLLHFRMSSKMC